MTKYLYLLISYINYEKMKEKKNINKKTALKITPKDSKAWRINDQYERHIHQVFKYMV